MKNNRWKSSDKEKETRGMRRFIRQVPEILPFICMLEKIYLKTKQTLRMGEQLLPNCVTHEDTRIPCTNLGQA